MQAFTEGKEIEYRTSCGWFSTNEPTWALNYEYRIKPEPIDGWYIVHEDGCVWQSHKTKSEAMAGLNELIESPELKVVHMREVVE